MVTKALRHLPGLFMPPRAQTSLLSPALACLRSLPQALALDHKLPAASPHSAWSCTAKYTPMFFSPRYFPAQPSSLQALPPPLPSLHHQCPLPSKAQSGLAPLQGAPGSRTTASAPLKGTAAPGGQRGVSPIDGEHAWQKEKKAPCVPCSPLQQILRGCSPSMPSHLPRPAQKPWPLQSSRAPGTEQPSRSWCSQKALFISHSFLLR